MTLKQFEDGQVVLATGIYRILHAAHTLPSEVALRKNDRFPSCSQCTDTVVFELIVALPNLFLGTGFGIYELPVWEKSRPTEERKLQHHS
jgi:hypothetical protein